MRALRKLVFGETLTLPLGVLASLALALTLHWVADGAAWWERGGGFIILACVIAVLTASLAPAWRRR
jgi:membrane protein YdbS with pleckstrin-like domain